MEKEELLAGTGGGCFGVLWSNRQRFSDSISKRKKTGNSGKKKNSICAVETESIISGERGG